MSDNPQEEKSFKTKIKHWLKTAIEFILNPRLLLCFGIGWIITNGWAYIAFAIATWLGIEWLIAVSGTYLTLLWIPATPEKIITIIVAIFLLKLIFPNDKKTLEKLYKMKEKIKTATIEAYHRRKEKRRKRKNREDVD